MSRTTDAHIAEWKNARTHRAIYDAFDDVLDALEAERDWADMWEQRTLEAGLRAAEAESTLAKVRELHEAEPDWRVAGKEFACGDCGTDWPCETVRILNQS